jgi:glycosyltransferase involved in cell wall biosynthesis
MEKIPDHMSGPQDLRIAVLIPCYNEELTVAKVVLDFRNHLPSARIIVFDNRSTDATSARALEAGAEVVLSPRKGKGFVVQQMFETIEADWLIMVDGDATYPASHAQMLLSEAISNGIDMMVGRRVTPKEELGKAYRPMHQLGNQMVCALIGSTFGSPIKDVFSGYRVFNRAFAKTVPLRAGGFEIEVEMTLQALSKGFRVEERDIPYGSRPEGSKSKLNTYRDGMIVLWTFASICRSYRPGLFFGLFSLLFAMASFGTGIAPILDYIQFQYVYKVPLAILATGLAMLSALSAAIGLILQSQLRYHNETHKLLRRINQ